MVINITKFFKKAHWGLVFYGEEKGKKGTKKIKDEKNQRQLLAPYTVAIQNIYLSIYTTDWLNLKRYKHNVHHETGIEATQLTKGNKGKAQEISHWFYKDLLLL